MDNPSSFLEISALLISHAPTTSLRCFFYHSLTHNNYGVGSILLNNVTIVYRLPDGYCETYILFN